MVSKREGKQNRIAGRNSYKLTGIEGLSKLMATVALALVLCIGLSACNSSSGSSDSINAGSSNGNTSGNVGNNGGTVSLVGSTNVGSGAGASNVNQPAATQAAQAVSNQTGGSLVNPTGNLETDIQAVVEKARPAVVLIVARGSQQEGAGTGSIVTPNGFIITNHHVIAPAGRGGSITVVLDNGQKQTAQVVGDVPSNDLAILKINGSNLPTIPLTSANTLKVGQWTVAIGNALALPGGPTVTTGIVSAIGRSITEPEGANLTDLVQTSAAINPGNSGGPLLNLQGQMIGINTAAPVDPESQSAAQGIGFAINIDQAKAVVQEYTNGNGVPAQSGGSNVSTRPYVGVTTQDVTAGIAARYNLSVSQGALITQVSNNSPAAQAGLKAGEVVIGLDGKQINTASDIQAILLRHKPGDVVPMVLAEQNGQQRQVNITLGTLPGQ